MDSIKNLNSAIVPTKSQVLFAVGRMGGDLEKLFHSTPIYLVDPVLMDSISPPERRRVLSPQKVSKMFRRRCEEIWERILTPLAKEGYDSLCDGFCETLDDFLNDFWRDIEECLEFAPEPDEMLCPEEELGVTSPNPEGPQAQPEPREEKKRRIIVFSSMGLYLSDISKVIPILKEYENHLIRKSGPAIFICPERVDQKAKILRNSFSYLGSKWLFQFAFAYILIHELAHAFMDGGISAYAIRERVIEDSMANAFAFLRLTEHHGKILDKETAVFLRLTADQPLLEYQNWEFFARPGYTILKSTARAWKARIVPFEHALMLFNTVFPNIGLWSGFPPFPPLPWLLTLPHITHSLRFRHLLHDLRYLYHELPYPWDRIGEIWYRMLRDIYEGRGFPLNKKRLFRMLSRFLRSPNRNFWSLVGMFLLFTSTERSVLHRWLRQFK